MTINKGRLLPVAALGIALATAALWWFWPEGEAAGRITFSGNIEMTQVEISFKMPGKVVLLAVQEGDEVKKGMVVARLDDRQLRWQREQAEAGLAAAESRLREVQAQIRFQEENMGGQVEQRRAELRQSEAKLRELRAGARPQEIEQAKAAVQRAQSQFEKADSDWRRAEELFKDQDISQIQHDQFRAARESTEATLRQAREQLDLVVEGARTEDVDAARAQVARAEAGLRLAQSLSLDIERARQSAQTLRAEIERARALTSQLDSQLEDTVAVSPVDGVALVKNVEPGEVVAAGTSVVSVGDVERPWLRGYIPERSLGRVKLGEKVRVTTDSFPDKTYWGEVTFIASEAEFTPKQIQTPEERIKLVYRIKVSLQNGDRELKLNMPCDAEILPQ